MHRIAVPFAAALMIAAVACASTATGAPIVDQRDRDLDGIHRLEYVTALGEPRTIQIEVRLPKDPDGSVVVWSHGGGRGTRNAETVGERWGRAFNRAGVTFIAIAHAPRTAEERETWCEQMGIAACDSARPLRWDRSHDATVVFDWVEDHADDLGIDMNQLVYGGHSAGSRGALVVAGATSSNPQVPVGPPDPRPVAFILASPPSAADFDHASLAAIDRPILALTGAGDTTKSTSPQQRLETIGLLEPATTYLTWVDHPDARHGTFNLEKLPDRATGRGLATAGVLFVDAVTTDRLSGFEGAFSSRAVGTGVELR